MDRYKLGKLLPKFFQEWDESTEIEEKEIRTRNEMVKILQLPINLYIFVLVYVILIICSFFTIHFIKMVSRQKLYTQSFN